LIFPLFSLLKTQSLSDGGKGRAISSSDVKKMLSDLGHPATDEEAFILISEVDEDSSGAIEFLEFLKMMEQQKARAAAAEEDAETLDAFVALGGNRDRSGSVPVERLKEVCKEFGLNVDIDDWVQSASSSLPSRVDYSQFKRMFVHASSS